MLIFIEKSLVLFATPKTASTAFHQALGPKAEMRFSKSGIYKHMPPRRFDKLFRPLVTTLAPSPITTVAVIREPIDWLHSWYRYRTRNDTHGSDTSTADVNFNTFIEAFLSKDKPAYAKLSSQAQFLTNKSSELCVDQLWRYDAVADLQMFLAFKLGHDFTLKHWNVSPKQALDISPENKRALEDHFQRDYDLYNTAIGSD